MSRNFQTLFIALAFLSFGKSNAQSFNTTLQGSPNNYYSPGDTAAIEIAISGSNFGVGNYLQYALAPLGIQSASQLIPVSLVTSPFYSQTGTYSTGFVVGSNVPYGSYLMFGQSSNPSTIDTVGYLTVGPPIIPSNWQESIVANTDYCFGAQITLTIDSIPLDSTLIDVPDDFPSGNVLWLPFSNSIREFRSLQMPNQIGLGYSLQSNRDNLSNSSYYINSTNSALLYSQSPSVALMSSYQGFNDSSEFAISFWVQRDSCSNGILFGRIDSLASGSFACYLTDSCTIGFVGAFSTQSFQISVERVEASINANWNHVVVEKSNGQLRLFINGQQQDATSLNGALYSPQPLAVVVGAPMSLLSDTIPLPGAFAALDDVGFWSRSLSTTEKASLYTANTFGMASTKTYHWSTNVLDTTCTLTLLTDTMVKLTVIDDQGSTYSDSVVILVNHPQILGQAENCAGQVTQLAAANIGFSNAFQYTWSTGDTTSAIAKTFSSSQNIWVQSNGLFSTCYDTAAVIINPLPGASITKTMPFNSTQTNVQLTVGSGSTSNNTYSWSTGESTSSLNIYPNQTTTYSVTVTTPKGCYSMDSITVDVESKVFIVNLENQFISTTPHIAGNFNSWSTTADSLTNIGGTLWAATLNLVKDDTIAYKFINGNSWQDPHDFTSCSSLSYQSMGNRYAALESLVDTIGPFHLSSCNNAPVVDLVTTDSVLACFGDTVVLSVTSLVDSVNWQTGANDYIYTLPYKYSGLIGLTAIYPNGVRLVDTINIIQDSYIDTAVTVYGSLEFCNGDTTSLALNPGYQILWNDQSTASFRSFTTSDTVYATLTSSLGCTSMTDTIILTSGVIPDVNLTVSSQNICNGDTAYVSVPYAPNVSYLWSNQANTSQTFVTSTSALFVVATDTLSGCNAQSSIVTITSHFVPNAPVILGDTAVSQGDTLKYLIQNPNPLLDYGWSLVGPGSWYSSNSDSSIVEIIWNNTGSAILEATAANSYCLGASSVTIFISSIGISENEVIKGLYPNPSNGLIYFDISQSIHEAVGVQLFSIDGTLVMNSTVDSSQNYLDLRHLPSGSYILKTDLGQTFNLIIQH